MESPLIEVTRSLYHLDYFRRNFRKLGWHQCEASSVTGVDCLVCSFKNVFHELSLLMRESVLDPPHIRQTIKSSIENAQFGKFKSIGNVPGSVPAHIQFETLLRQLEESSAMPDSVPLDGSMSASAQSLKLHTEFSYTKICLHCRTTSYVDVVTQYIMQIDAANFVSDDWPSFEFAIKTSLDSGEFCVQPNCHGQTKVFRLLRTLPHFLPMYFADSASVSLITFLPTRLRPHLIFESSSSVADLILKGLILYSPQWGYATIFYHSRLELWVFIDSRRVLTLNRTWIESRFHPITHGFAVVFCFYCRDDIPSANASANSHYLSPPNVPTKRVGGTTTPSFNPKPQSEYDTSRIYENWPLDTDSGQGSECSSTNSSSSASMFSNMKVPNPRDSLYSNSTKQSFEEGNSAGSGSGGSRRNSPTKSPSILSSEGKESGNGKYATVRRKMKYHGRGVKGNLASLSMSAPDLRVLVPPAPSCPVVPLTATTASIIPVQSPTTISSNLLPPTNTTLPVALSPQSNFSDISSICSSSKATDRSSNGSKKVSFNCEVTLVDDPDDEYIPHPIFQSILQKLQQNGSGSRSSVSGGSTC